MSREADQQPQELEAGQQVQDDTARATSKVSADEQQLEQSTQQQNVAVVDVHHSGKDDVDGSDGGGEHGASVQSVGTDDDIAQIEVEETIPQEVTFFTKFRSKSFQSLFF